MDNMEKQEHMEYVGSPPEPRECNGSSSKQCKHREKRERKEREREEQLKMQEEEQVEQEETQPVQTGKNTTRTERIMHLCCGAVYKMYLFNF